MRGFRRKAARSLGAGVDGAEGQEAAHEPGTFSRTRGRLQVLLAVVCAGGVFVGVRLSHVHKSAPPAALTVPAFVGTWELQSVNGAPVGEKTSAVLSQQITLQDGALHGETHLRADSEAATLAMPFPDSSVTAVTAGADGHDVIVTWNGSYKPIRDRLVELTVGKATCRVEVETDPQTHTLRLNRDAILTYPGAARYVASPAH